ncbi:RHS repeat-associated core domain-containing protein, partial [Listeria monocytogenes]|nr:RHS repeat-associated core domain-containing protein [Listeria monocytogenes]
ALRIVVLPGEALSQGSTQVNLRFPGQYYDAESGLHYNYFRDYDPETGRYGESDPIGLSGGVNTYGYVQGAPLNRINP